MTTNKEIGQETTVTVFDGAEFSHNGVTLKVYRDALWIDGGDNDDFRVTDVELDDEDEVELEITPAIDSKIEFFKANR